MKKLTQLLSVLLVVMTQVVIAQTAYVPAGWFKAGSKPDSFEMGYDEATVKDGEKSAYIQSNVEAENVFGTLMQVCTAEAFLGKTVIMSGYLKSEEVDGWAGLWLRIDAKEERRALGFDNMNDRAVRGTTDWTKYEIELEVPANSGALNFGALLSGGGKIWVDRIAFEIKGEGEVNESTHGELPLPINTGFEF